MASARGLQREDGAAIMLFPPFLYPLPFAFTPLRRPSLAALTPLVQKEASRRELTGGK